MTAPSPLTPDEIAAVRKPVADGVGSRRTVRSRYDIPPPKDDGDAEPGDIPAMLLPRSAARAGARARARR